MSGHSKWSTIKRKKGAADAKRGQLFTRLTREIVIAVRESGGDPEGNFRLRIAIDRARAVNMPKDNIDRAIRRGSGEDKDGVVIEQISYEGYGPHGIAILVDCLTENRNRTVSELRHVLTRAGGSMGEVGSVSWQFDRIAYFGIEGEGVNFDKLFELALEGGANDITQDEEGYIEIIAPVEAFKTISDLLKNANIEIDEAELRMLPKQELALPIDQTIKVMRLIEDIEDLDDVQSVYSNLEVSDEALAAMEEE